MTHVRSNQRPAFTLVEVMFSIIVFGIGLIMVAAIFPVAIQQSRLNNEETAAAATALVGTDALERCASETFYPNTGPSNGALVSFSQSLFDLYASGNCVITSDPRLAWVSVYSRAAGARYAQTFVFALQARDVSSYKNYSATPGAFVLVNQYPRLITITTTATSITVGTPVASAVATRDAVVERGFVVIADDKNLPALYNGRILRIGNRDPSTPYKFDLAPGYDQAPTISGGTAYVVGKTYDPVSATFSGAAQDVAVYSSLVPIK